MALGVDKELSEVVCRQKVDIDPEFQLQKLATEKIEVISVFDSDFPPLLKEIKQPPTLLYYQGQRKLFGSGLVLAIVGTRKASGYGRSAVESLMCQMSEWGLLVVTGGAFGIDSVVTETALALGLPCAVVLGSGLQYKTPASNYSLFNKLQANGLILSEYLPWQQAHRFNFPQRNRIISGMAQGTIVVEAPKKSGALITAEFALEQNRNVGVVPGPINNPHWLGSNEFIKSGAALITDVSDIKELLGLPP